VESASLYQYAAGVAIGAVDPSGLATIIACSGINSDDNYVKGWLESEEYAVDEGASRQSSCHARDVNRLSSGFVSHPFSSVTLNEEAEAQARSRPMPSRCRADGRPIKLEVVMVSPKTNLTPAACGLRGDGRHGSPPTADWKSDCCDVRFTVIDDPMDAVPNQGIGEDIARGRQDHWDGYGEVFRVDNIRCGCGDYNDVPFARHDFGNFLRPCPLPLLQLKKYDGPYGPSSHWARDGRRIAVGRILDDAIQRAGGDGTVIVCHSQGCNLAMRQLRNLCECPKK
jgi:hypothetical protein